MSNSFGGGTSSGSRSVTARPEAMWAANNFTDYLKSLNTSTVDNTYQNIANNAYELFVSAAQLRLQRGRLRRRAPADGKRRI